MDLQLKGRIALITGGTKGIGAGCATALAREGADIVAVYRSDEEGSQAFVRELAQTYGVRAIAVKADVTFPEQVEAAFDEANEKLGLVDILVNNAARTYARGPIDTMTYEGWVKSMDGVLNHVFTVSRRFVADLKAAGRGGHIVNVLAKSAIVSNSKYKTAYNASKGGETAMTRSMANELIDFGIYVNGIVPGYVRTSVYQEGSEGEMTKAKFLRVGWAMPIDMGNVAAFLCSPMAKQVIGAVVDCSGGTMMCPGG
jgi:NAD(P)-dependent dehydrogenase (short-subunit alcohol dehydrogenase family)